MRFIITKGLICGLTLPTTDPMEIGEFKLLPAFSGERSVNYIQTEIEASTREEAIKKSSTIFGDFLASLTLISNASYILIPDTSVRQIGSTKETRTLTITAKGFITKDAQLVKNDYEVRIIGRKLRKNVVRQHSEGVNGDDAFSKYISFYKILEIYLKETGRITRWIRAEEPRVQMKKDIRGRDITIYTWIRHKMSHGKRSKEDLKPLLISNPKDVFLVNKYLPRIRNLARRKIRTEEGI